MEQNKRKFSLLNKTYLFGVLVYVLYFLSCMVSSFCLKNYAYLISSIFCLMCGIFSIFLNDLNTKLFIKLSKNKAMKKAARYTLFIFLNIFKFLIIFIPLLTILIIKITNGSLVYFDLYTIIAGTLIAPCYIIISQIVLLKTKSKNVSK